MDCTTTVTSTPRKQLNPQPVLQHKNNITQSAQYKTFTTTQLSHKTVLPKKQRKWPISWTIFLSKQQQHKQLNKQSVLPHKNNTAQVPQTIDCATKKRQRRKDKTPDTQKHHDRSNTRIPKNMITKGYVKYFPDPSHPSWTKHSAH